MTLDPPMTATEIRFEAARRQLARYGRIIDIGLLEPHELAKLERVTTGTAAEAVTGLRSTAQQHPGPFHLARQPDPAVTAPIVARRELNTLWLEIQSAPRTKKNHGQAFGIKQSIPYKRFKLDVVSAVLTVRHALFLPLPDQAYNIQALYFVDRYGKNADKVGLDQGLYDALEAAGVVSNDRWFRRADGTRMVFDDPRPRVEVIITPLGSET